MEEMTESYEESTPTKNPVAEGPQFLTFSQMQTLISRESPALPDEETFSIEVPSRSVSSNIGTNLSGEFFRSQQVKVPNLSGQQSLYVTQSQAPIQSQVSETLTYSMSQLQMPNIEEVSGEYQSESQVNLNNNIDDLLTQLDTRIKNITDKPVIECLSVQQSEYDSMKDSSGLVPRLKKSDTQNTTAYSQLQEALKEKNEKILELTDENKCLVTSLEERQTQIGTLCQENNKLTNEISRLKQELQSYKENKLEMQLSLELYETRKKKEINELKQQNEVQIKQMRMEHEQNLIALVAQIDELNKGHKLMVTTLKQQQEIVAKDNKQLSQRIKKKNQLLKQFEAQLKEERDSRMKWLTKEDTISTMKKEPSIQQSFESQRQSERPELRQLLHQMKNEHNVLIRTTDKLMQLTRDIEDRTFELSPKPKQNLANYFSNSESNLRNTEKKPISNYLGTKTIQNVAYQQQQIIRSPHHPVQFNIVQFPVQVVGRQQQRLF